jgi:hypothetical protein
VNIIVAISELHAQFKATAETFERTGHATRETCKRAANSLVSAGGEDQARD